jgi:hypothetical protein
MKDLIKKLVLALEDKTNQELISMSSLRAAESQPDDMNSTIKEKVTF